MKPEYNSDLSFYITEEKLPLYVSQVFGDHPQRMFHTHSYTEMVFITAGEMIHIVENDSYKVTAGDVLLIHPGVTHGYDHTAGAEITNVIFDVRQLPLPLLDGGELPLFKQIFTPDKKYLSAKPLLHLEPNELTRISELTSRLDDELKNIHPGGMFFALAIFMQITTEISRFSSFQQPSQRIRFMVGNALKYMNKHYAERITLNKLARLSCMSERSFQRHFQQSIGAAPMEYLQKIRLQQVQHLLVTSDAEIGTIAINCGFYDSNYLCKKFKETFQITPSQFRMKHKSS